MADKATLFPIVLCVLLIGGFANYRRNAHMSEQFENRSYASLRNADLDALIQAYQSEIDRIQVWLGNEPIESRGAKRRDDGHLDARIKRFESFPTAPWSRCRGYSLPSGTSSKIPNTCWRARCTGGRS